MTRKLELEEHLSSSELEKEYKNSKDPVESRRYHLLWLVSQDYGLIEAAKVVRLNYNYGYKIVKRYNQQGVEGLKNRRKLRCPGKTRALLNENQEQELLEQLESPPSDGGVWTGPKVARWIEKVTGRPKVWNQRGWDYLKKLKQSWQRPRPHHAQGDHQEQEAFKKNCLNGSSKVKVPDGIHIEFLPPYSPELQPAERLWHLTDEPLVNQCFDTIEVMEDLLVERCLTLANSMHEQVRRLTHFQNNIKS